MQNRAEIEAAFRGSTLRCTPQRYAVLEYLLRNHKHATADEIFEAVNCQDSRTSRATVYNSLHALVRAGLIREVLSEGAAARFDAALEKHHHFVCETCGVIEDVAWFELPQTWDLRKGRKVRDYEVVFRGTCARCSKKEHHG